MNIRVTIEDLGLRSLIDRVTGPKARARLHAAMGTEVQQATAAHVGALKRAPDSLASKFGAPTTNFYAHAAERIESPAALASDANAATLTLNYPGAARAFRSITIVPVNAKALAIPVNRLAFGRSPRDCWAELGLFIPKGKDYIAMRVGTQIQMMWLLRRSVTQPQNRALLPSMEEWQAAASLGAGRWFDQEISRKEN